MQNLPRCQAQDRLANGKYDPTDYQGIYRLTMQATGSKAQAQRAAAEAAAALVERDTEAARQARIAQR